MSRQRQLGCRTVCGRVQLERVIIAVMMDVFIQAGREAERECVGGP